MVLLVAKWCRILSIHSRKQPLGLRNSDSEHSVSLAREEKRNSERAVEKLCYPLDSGHVQRVLDQGCGIKGFIPTSVQGNPFPTALDQDIRIPVWGDHAPCIPSFDRCCNKKDPVLDGEKRGDIQGGTVSEAEIRRGRMVQKSRKFKENQPNADRCPFWFFCSKVLLAPAKPGGEITCQGPGKEMAIPGLPGG